MTLLCQFWDPFSQMFIFAYFTKKLVIEIANNIIEN